ncbi:hypothetical protein C3747_89g146 [Trypanosoma cruzi]|uniref:Uncharacterized protein n=2 Tax=Trypanosoma cruzi TaxID=5693 RepID=Q4CVK8_TRYCC|nr:hypothetical protein, conserved [Trypanosoma cruzi]EAN84312.1 hypothetical protein, conserved [Trypanosoma cruzi]PWV08499.1 hypothetical protein C3747_89g146 [Trypanosoma cruzi]RNC49429.1 hypothetical protein TcCL_NonESM00656 [Trypanosoma cruzi]|eukprot:XP_806163.1 hypothetical protein [Trypanosoma cruzi strain CL Brener]
MDDLWDVGGERWASPTVLRSPRRSKYSCIRARVSPAVSASSSPSRVTSMAFRRTPEARRDPKAEQPLDASCFQLKDAVTSLLDFCDNTLPVWGKRVSGLDGHARDLSLADVGFLERASRRLAIYLDRIRETMELLQPYTQGPVAVSKWGRYAQRLFASLTSAQKAADAIGFHVARLLSLYATAPPVSPASAQWVIPARHSKVRSAGVTPRRVSDDGISRGVSSTVRPLLHDSFSVSQRSNATPSEPPTFLSPSNPCTPPREHMSPQSVAMIFDGKSGHSAYQRSQLKKKQQQPQRQQQQTYQQGHDLTPSTLQPLSRGQIPSEPSSEGLNSVSSSHSRFSRSSEPVFEVGRTHMRLPERRRNTHSNVGHDGSPTRDYFPKGGHNHANFGDCIEGGSFDCFKKHQNFKESLTPEQRRLLLERIDLIERLPGAPSKLEAEEAKGIFAMLYGPRLGRRQYLDWVEERELRALRRR